MKIYLEKKRNATNAIIDIVQLPVGDVDYAVKTAAGEFILTDFESFGDGDVAGVLVTERHKPVRFIARADVLELELPLTSNEQFNLAARQ